MKSWVRDGFGSAAAHPDQPPPVAPLASGTVAFALSVAEGDSVLGVYHQGAR